MVIELATDIREVNLFFDSTLQEADVSIIDALSKLGKMCLKESREKSQLDTFFDQSGDLRSSIGCVISYKGNIVEVLGFDVVLNGHNGATKGKTFAHEIAKKQAEEFVLVCVAGEEYAVYVEAMENKAVIADAELFAMQELPKMLQQLG